MDRRSVAHLVPFLFARVFKIIREINVTQPTEESSSRVLKELLNTDEYKVLSTPTAESILGKYDNDFINDGIRITIKSFIKKNSEEKHRLFDGVEKEFNRLKDSHPLWYEFVLKQVGISPTFRDFYSNTPPLISSETIHEDNENSSIPSLEHVQPPNFIPEKESSESQRSVPKQKKRHVRRVNLKPSRTSSPSPSLQSPSHEKRRNKIKLIFSSDEDSEVVTHSETISKQPPQEKLPEQENSTNVLENVISFIGKLHSNLDVVKKETEILKTSLEKKKMKLDETRSVCNCNQKVQGQPYYRCDQCSTFFHMICEYTHALKIMTTSKCNTCSSKQ